MCPRRDRRSPRHDHGPQHRHRDEARAPGEEIKPFRERKVRSVAGGIRSYLAKWGATHTGALANAWPEMPDGIVDRAADVWEPLLAVADEVGGHWPERARQAAVALNAARAQRDPSLGVQLLADCRRIYAERTVDRLTQVTPRRFVERGQCLDERFRRFGSSHSRTALAAAAGGSGSPIPTPQPQGEAHDNRT